MKHLICSIALICSMYCMSETLKVGYTEMTPMAYTSDGRIQGVDIDILDAISKSANFSYELIPLKRSERFDVLNSGKVDILIGGVSITRDREKIVDFTIPYMSSGLLAATLYDEGNNILNFIKSNKIIWKCFSILFLVAILFAHIIWIAERGFHGKAHRQEDSGQIDDRYFPGIFQAMWYTWITLVTVGYGDFVSKKWIGRIAIFFMTVIGIPLVASISAEIITNKIRIEKLSKYNTLSELEGLKIAYLKDTTSQHAETLINAQFIKVSEEKELLDLLKSGEVDAIIDDAPAIYNMKKNHIDKIDIIDKLFDKQNYGFAVKTQSPLREKMNIEILDLIQTGRMDDIQMKWLGKSLN